ncbi:MAG: hypothetical protein K1X79_14535 [Oligoflexia bacterium]|nr:hypothetical protein [Oligoflexia bacterium]
MGKNFRTFEAVKRLATLLVVVGVVGCASSTQNRSQVALVAPSLQTQAPRDEELLRVNSVLLLPSLMEERTKGSGILPSSLDAEFESLVREALSIDIIGGKKTRPLNTSLKAADLVKRFRPDATLQLRLYTYKERKGSAVGVSEPASVGFELSLLRASDAATVWNASFFKQDEALTDNLLRLDERIKSSDAPQWSTAQNMLKSGLRQALQDLADRRVAQFAK